MKKILIIKAHPSTKGFTHEISKKYSLLNKEKGNNVEILDLYDKKNQLNFLSFEDMKNMPKSELVISMQNKISNADELVFISPIWWADVPAILKNFIDQVFRSNFAFKYENGSAIPMLKNKTAKIILTCDAPSFIYKFPFSNLKFKWSKLVLGFCGIKVTNFLILDKMKKRDEKFRNNFLENLSKF